MIELGENPIKSSADLTFDQIKDRFQSDCTKCASLCCVSLHVEKSDKFAIDKPAGTPCPNLKNDGQCKIHAFLKNRGFEGCVDYDCFGAGQRVVQDLYDGISWQITPKNLPNMSEDFAKMRRIYKWLGLIITARNLPLPPSLNAECDALLALFCPSQGWTRAGFDAFDEQNSKTQATAFLYQLKDLV